MTDACPGMQRGVIASLPWYDLPATHTQLDALWKVLRELITEETGLTPAEDLERGVPVASQWQSPGLVLSQCCGPDLFDGGRELSVIGRPVLKGIGRPPGQYYSRIIVTSGQPLAENPTIAINGESSWSGHLALRDWFDRNDIAPGETVVSGSHACSIELVRNGRANLAAIDAFSWQFLDQAGVDAIDRTAMAPSPPFVCHKASPVPPAVMQRLLETALARLDHPMFAAVLPADLDTYAQYIN